MKRKLILTLLAVLLSALVTVSVSAAGLYVYDTANILPGSDEMDLNEKLEGLSERYSFDFYVATVDSTEGTAGQQYADGLYEYLVSNMGARSDGILLLWVTSESAAYITTTGYGTYAFTDAGLDHVFDQISASLRSRDFTGAFNRFADTAADLVDRAKAGNRYTGASEGGSSRRGANPLSVLFGSALVGFIPAGIVTGSWKSRLKSVHRQTGASVYTVPGSLVVRKDRESFLYNEVTRTKKVSGTTVHKSASGQEHGGASRKF